MPAETPTINSTRVLRAYRINAMENVLLRNRMLGMQKENRRDIRLTNQDIRLIKLTLDYINSSSGESPEGRPPTYRPPPVERDEGPYFMYGDRLQSRKVTKRRVQSAHVSFGRRDSASNSENGSVSGGDSQQSDKQHQKARPKSSPLIRQRRHGSTSHPTKFGFRPAETGVYLPGENGELRKTDSHPCLQTASDNETGNGTAINDTVSASAFDLTIPEEDENNSADTQSVYSQASTSGYSGVVRKPSRPMSSKARPPSSKAFITTGSPSPAASRVSSATTKSKSQQHLNNDKQNASVAPDTSEKALRLKQQEKSEHLKKRVSEERYKLQSARKTKPTPREAWEAPAGSPKKMEEVSAYKGRINEGRQKMIQDKLDAFKLQYPTKRY